MSLCGLFFLFSSTHPLPFNEPPVLAASGVCYRLSPFLWSTHPFIFSSSCLDGWDKDKDKDGPALPSWSPWSKDWTQFFFFFTPCVLSIPFFAQLHGCGNKGPQIARHGVKSLELSSFFLFLACAAHPCLLTCIHPISFCFLCPLVELHHSKSCVHPCQGTTFF